MSFWRTSIDIFGCAAVLETTLDHDFLADISQRVGDGPCRSVAPEHVTHVTACNAIPSHICEIPA